MAAVTTSGAEIVRRRSVTARRTALSIAHQRSDTYTGKSPTVINKPDAKPVDAGPVVAISDPARRYRRRLDGASQARRGGISQREAVGFRGKIIPLEGHAVRSRGDEPRPGERYQRKVRRGGVAGRQRKKFAEARLPAAPIAARHRVRCR